MWPTQYEASRSNFLLAAVNSRRRIENVMCCIVGTKAAGRLNCLVVTLINLDAIVGKGGVSDENV